jgi:hypothetical protein
MSAPQTITSLDGPAFESAPPPARVQESAAVNFGRLLAGFNTGDGSFANWWPADRVTLPNNSPSPGIFSEMQWRAIVTWSRFLCERNMFAIGFRDRLRDFVGPVTVQFVKRGQNPGTQDADGNGVPDDPLVAAVQQVWDEWCEESDWGQGEEDRERECRERLCEDGEVTLRLGPTRGGLPWVRFIEPEQIRRPAWSVSTDGDWEWGVCTPRDDAETVRALAVCDPGSGGSTGEELTPDQFVRMKGNVKRTMKRGMPDFYPVESNLQVALGLLSNLGTTGKAQSAIAWIQQYATATPDQVLAMIRQGADAYARFGQTGGPQPGTTVASNGGPTLPAKDYPAGSVIHADQNRQYAPGPVSTGVPSFVQIVDSTLKATGFRFGIPDWFTSGDGQSFAAALVTGSPFVRSIQDRQAKVIGFVKALALRVIQLAERAGRLPAGTSEKVRPIATAQPVVIADEEKQSRTFLSLFDKNVADPIDFIKKRGGDPKVVAANIQAWQKKFAPQQPAAPGGGNPPAAPGAGGKDPEPAPPGSAGGDGSSPNKPEGELATLLAEEGSPGLVEKEVTVHRGGQTFTQHRKVRADEPAGGKQNLFDQIDGAAARDLSSADRAEFKRDARAAVDWAATAKAVRGEPQSKQMRAARGYRDVARRRRIIKAVRNEAELADAIQGYNLPDSEPADVVHVLDATGKPIRDRAVVKHVLAQREHIVKELKNKATDPERRKVLEHVMARQQVHFFEVKTLLTAAKSAVHVNGPAMKRKARWAAKYGATFHLVALDDRRGQKHSGHRVYVAANKLAGTNHLDQMTRAADLASVLGHATGKAGV